MSLDIAEVENHDAKLLAKIASQHHKAYNEFVTRYLQQIFKFVKRYISQPAQAEDITQDVFMRVWVNAASWKKTAQGSVRSWLYKIAYNRCMDELRQKRDFDDNAQDPVHAITPEQLAIERDNDRQINLAVAQLPERQRTALYLCAYQGLSNIEAAASMQISIEALESLLARARRQLRKDVRLEEIHHEVQHG